MKLIKLLKLMLHSYNKKIIIKLVEYHRVPQINTLFSKFVL